MTAKLISQGRPFLALVGCCTLAIACHFLFPERGLIAELSKVFFVVCGLMSVALIRDDDEEA